MLKKKEFLHYSKQCIDHTDLKCIEKVLKSDFLTTGPEVKKFENKLSNYVGSKYAVVCSNGSVALYLACLSLNLPKGTKIIIPSITFAAAANVAKMLDFKIIFCDVESSSGLVTKNILEDTIIENKITKGLFLPVHLNGQSVDLPEISKVCNKYSISIIEDASHALGTKIMKRKKISKIGSCDYSKMTTFSFHPVKNITMGEGGAITTNDKTLYEKIILLRNNGIQRDPKFFSNKGAYDKNNILNPNHYEIQSIGLNFRASDLNCALGTNQLNKIEKFIIKRKKIVERYDEKFSSLADFLKPVKKFNFCNTSYHLYVLLIDFEKIGLTRAHIINQLKNRNIGVQVHYPPLHLQKIYGFSKKLTGSEEYYKKCLSLPLFPQLTFSDVDYVAMQLKNLIKKI